MAKHARIPDNNADRLRQVQCRSVYSAPDPPRPEGMQMSKGDPGQVLDVVRDVLIEHMDGPDALPHDRIQSAVDIGQTMGVGVVNEE